MSVNLTIAGTSYSVPSSAADTNWAADQVAWEQAVSAAINTRTPSWQTPTYVNSWANKGSGFRTGRFYKNQWGEVFIEGCVSGGAESTVVFTLPSGYRPAQTLVFQIKVSGSGGFNTATIASDGTVTMGANEGGGSCNTFATLCGIHFNVNT